MKSNHIVHGGGWVKRQTVARPRTRLFALISLVWLGVALPASIPFWLSNSQSPWLGTEWFCFFLMLLELVWVGLTILFAKTEKPREISAWIPNPNHDIRKLY
jgi:hypothetical protein